MSVLGSQIDTLRRLQSREIVGSVAAVRGLSLLVDDLPLPVGAMVRIDETDASRTIRGEVIGFDGARCIVMLFDGGEGIRRGTRLGVIPRPLALSRPGCPPGSVHLAAWSFRPSLLNY